MKITKKQAVAIAIKEGKVYRDKLANTCLLILYRDKDDNQLKTLEIEFQPDKYQHLTGLLLTTTDKEIGKNVIREHTALEFYHRCVDKPYITEAEIEFKDPSTIDLKMMALPYITQITKITKMSGEYNYSKPHLDADYIIGGINACIGVSKYDDRNTYFPRTCLKEDIRKITTYTSPVLAIFQTQLPNNDSVYKHLRYVAKGVNLNNMHFPKNISDKISLEEYVSNVNNEKLIISKETEKMLMQKPHTKDKEDKTIDENDIINIGELDEEEYDYDNR